MFRRALKALVRNPGVAYIERKVEGETRRGDKDEDRRFGVGESRTRTVTPLMRRNMKEGEPIASRVIVIPSSPCLNPTLLNSLRARSDIIFRVMGVDDIGRIKKPQSLPRTRIGIPRSLNEHYDRPPGSHPTVNERMAVVHCPLISSWLQMHVKQPTTARNGN